VAVIGASRNPASIGGAVFLNLLRSGFTGTVFPVNPNAGSVAGVLAYPSVRDVPGDVDLAVIVVPAEKALEVVDECGKKGVAGLVIISAGFGETGEDGKQRQRELREKILSYGMRLVGPNCLGVMNLDPQVRLNATFAPTLPPSGNVSIGTQSGALGLALLDHAKSMGLGLAQFVSIGNRVDISSNDLLEFWEDDKNTDVILLYEESFGNPRKFSRIARRVSRKKPIIVVKAGRSAVGARAASSHTGALAAADVAVDAMFRQAGVTRVDTIEEMFNVAEMLAHQPAPAGNRVAILTNAGGPGVLAADACEGWGLVVPALLQETQAKLRQFLPAAAATANPVDMIASAPPEAFKNCLSVMLEATEIDSIIVIYIPPLVTKPEDVAAAIREAMSGYQGSKPVLACFMMSEEASLNLQVNPRLRLPNFIFPEDAVRALARAYRYSQYRNMEEGHIPRYKDIDPEKMRAMVFSSTRVDEGGTWLMPETAVELLKGYGMPVAETRVAYSAEEAAEKAKEIGFPVVMKVRSATIVHKTDIGGIALGLASGEQVRHAFRDMKARITAAGRGSEMQGIILQRMIPGGQEVIIGMSQDRLFGPLVMVGLGGVQVELIKDVAFSLQPLRDVDPDRMLKQLKTLPLLQGWRGSQPRDIDTLKEMLLRFSVLIEHFPEIEQMEMNPVLVFNKGQGCAAVDARILIKPVKQA
jgi:acetyl coenzyme A synthetase (ADP forming)-like protein